MQRTSRPLDRQIARDCMIVTLHQLQAGLALQHSRHLHSGILLRVVDSRTRWVSLACNRIRACQISAESGSIKSIKCCVTATIGTDTSILALTKFAKKSLQQNIPVKITFCGARTKRKFRSHKPKNTPTKCTKNFSSLRPNMKVSRRESEV